MPVVNDIIGCNDNMGIVHGHILWLNTNILAINWASNSIAKLDHPCVLDKIWLSQLGDQNTIVSTCLDVAKRFHVFDRLFIDLGVPKGDAHVGSLRLTIGKDDRAVEEGPHVLWLDISKQDVGVDSENNSKTKAFPSDGVDHA